MSKKHFIALADAIKEHDDRADFRHQFTMIQLEALARFCKQQNSNFNRERWLSYIAGTCGPNGGAR